MNTKEAIYFLEHDIKLFPHEAKSLPACLEIHKCAERIEEVIELLERREKYLQGDLYAIQFYMKYYNMWKVLKANTDKETINYMNKLEQKCFPKGVKK